MKIRLRIPFQKQWIPKAVSTPEVETPKEKAFSFEGLEKRKFEESSRKNFHDPFRGKKKKMKSQLDKLRIKSMSRDDGFANDYLWAEMKQESYSACAWAIWEAKGQRSFTYGLDELKGETGIPASSG